MSAHSHDALPEFAGAPKQSDAPAPADLTEDIADEITSELDPAPQWSSPAPAPAVEYGAANDALTDHLAQAPAGVVLRDRYVLEARIGCGGTALVYRAVDLRRDPASTDGHRVAIKLLRPELRDRPQNIARLQREFRQTRALAHPNVVRFHDLDCDRGSWFIVMELLTGETLGSRLRRSSPTGLPRCDALRIAAAVGDALGHAHGLGVTHGDVKPGNIFLTDAGEVRVLDFGVAPRSPGTPAADSPPLPPVGAAATRAYASPEVLAGEVPGPRDDVFSLACVTYEMLAGAHPYGRQGADAAFSARMVPPPLAALDMSCWSALAAALDLSRAARPTVAGLIRGLRGEPAPREAAGAGGGSSRPIEALPSPDTAAPVAARAPAPWRSLRIAGVLVAAALALALGVVIGRTSHRPAPGRSERLPRPAAMAQQPYAPPPIAVPEPAEPMPPAAVQPGPPAVAIADEPVTQPGVVSFDAPTMIVSRRAVLAAIPLRHLDHAERTVTVNWRVIDGSARLGRDIGGPEDGVETFFEGNTFRILYVPVVTDAAALRDRSFAVELTATSTGAVLGANRRIEVTIQGGT